MAQGLTVRERKLGRYHAVGLAWHALRLVEIDSRLDAKERLDTLLHEIIHILFPDMPEKTVKRISRVLSRAVWKDGYRRIHK